MEALGSIKNLRYLDLQGSNIYYMAGVGKAMREILQNSANTLEGAEFHLSWNAEGLFDQWPKDKQVAGQHYMSALKILTLSGLHVDENVIKVWDKAINFMALRELTVSNFEDKEYLLFQHLTSQSTLAQSGNKPISLRKLFLRMSGQSYGCTAELKAADLKSKCDFLSSFDTLTSLELSQYGEYSSNIMTNPGLSRYLLQGILKHKRLQTLKISYAGMSSQIKIPFLSGWEVEQLVTGLPDLREFQFAPDEHQIVRSITYSEHSITLTIFRMPSAQPSPPGKA